MKNKKWLICILCFTVGSVFFAFDWSISPKEMVGVYWGAFNPLTPAHQEIILTSVNHHKIKKIFVVINNHSYKTYSFSLEERIAKVKDFIEQNRLKSVEVLSQDDTNPVDYDFFAKKKKCSICVIAGYDSYQKWIQYSKEHERAKYDAIAVVPRGDAEPVLYDKNAFLLPIDSKFKYVSSTRMREITP